jgi:hypothetical protein
MTKSFLIVLVCLLLPATALAQQPGSGTTPGSANPAGSANPGSATPPPSDPMPAPPTATSDAAALRKICVDAMNADKAFAEKIVATANENAALLRLQLDVKQHEKAAAAIAKNEKHVILAYAAMWLVAIGFVLFLWMRQQALRNEIGQLKADLDAATKGSK